MNIDFKAKGNPVASGTKFLGKKYHPRLANNEKGRWGLAAGKGFNH